LAVALAIAFASALRFLKWLVPFICQRLDERADRIDEREQRVERRMVKRLEHVEHELELYREALMLLFNRMAEKDPADPVLRDVAAILRRAVPINFNEPDQDLIDKLDKGGNQ
jgi:guanylate kinase